MEITVTARHFQLDTNLRKYVEEEVQDLSRFFDRILEVHVILEQEGYRQAAEVVVHLPLAHRLRARGDGNDMRLAFDDAVAKLTTQIKRFKGKLHGNKRRGRKTQE